MKPLFFLFTVLFFVGGLTSSCSNQKAGSCQESSSTVQESSSAVQADQDWEAAKEAYHDAMSATFHPAEEGDLAPLKSRYTELATLSQQWASLPLPESQKDKEVEAVLQELAEKSAAIGTVVKGGTDEEITAAVTELHDVFHRIVELCDH